MAQTGSGSLEEGRTPIAGGRRGPFVAPSAGTGLIGAAMVVLGAWLVLSGGNLYHPVVGVLPTAAAGARGRPGFGHDPRAPGAAIRGDNAAGHAWPRTDGGDSPVAFTLE